MQSIIPAIVMSLACTCMAQIRPFPYELRNGIADMPLTQPSLDSIASSLNNVQASFNDLQAARTQARLNERLTNNVNDVQASLVDVQMNIKPINTAPSSNIYIEPSQGIYR